MLSESEIRKQFADGYDFPPLKIRLVSDPFSAPDNGFDAILELIAEEQNFTFAAEFKSRNSPRIFEDAIFGIERAAWKQKLLPMLVMPYLREEQLQQLQQRRISGIDLSGNGVVTIPGRLFVYRTGAENKYPDSAPTKYAYRGTTSLVARAFLCRTKYKSLADIADEIKKRGGNVVFSTISKAIKRMQSDLIVERTEQGFRLVQAEKLLRQLSDSFTPPKITRTQTFALRKQPLTETGKPVTASGLNMVAKLPLDRLPIGGGMMVLSGASSIGNYAVMGRQDRPIAYTPSIDRLRKLWGDLVEETSRFADFELQETEDPTVYFDSRLNQNLPYASPIQAFLECSTGDKREQETAEQVKRLILRELNA